MTMPTLRNDRFLAVLVILMAITLFSWLMPHTATLQPKTLGVLLLCLAFLKAQLIISQYMELGGAHPAVRTAFGIWVLVSCAMVIPPKTSGAQK